MEHKLMVAKNLREGLAKIKALYKKLLAENPLWEQWAYLRMYEAGMQWEHDRKEEAFVKQSRQLLKRLTGD